jgi:hypothetical protein
VAEAQWCCPHWLPTSFGGVQRYSLYLALDMKDREAVQYFLSYVVLVHGLNELGNREPWARLCLLMTWSVGQPWAQSGLASHTWAGKG